MKEILKILEQIQDLRNKERAEQLEDSKVDSAIYKSSGETSFEIDKLISIAIDLALWSK